MDHLARALGQQAWSEIAGQAEAVPASLGDRSKQPNRLREGTQGGRGADRMTGHYALGVAAAAALFSVAASAAEARCNDDVRGPTAKANATKLAELQANSGNASFILPVGDARAGSDDVTFDTKPRTTIGGADTAATAAILNFPRSGGERFPAAVRVRAKPGPTDHRITLAVCVTGKHRFTAGTYQGSILIYGPRLNETTYPVAITSKWPAWVPIVT